jgi:hypothetical protein
MTAPLADYASLVIIDMDPVVEEQEADRERRMLDASHCRCRQCAEDRTGRRYTRLVPRSPGVESGKETQ